MSDTNRHREPTTRVILRRIYKQLLERLRELTGDVRFLAPQVRRLVREKEIIHNAGRELLVRYRRLREQLTAAEAVMVEQADTIAAQMNEIDRLTVERDHWRERSKRVRELEAALLWTMEEWFADDAVNLAIKQSIIDDHGDALVNEFAARASTTPAAKRMAMFPPNSRKN
jgi:hypothetical protein